MVYSLAGSYYVKAEISHISNVRLLDEIKEGVYVIDKDTNEVLFQNAKA